MSITIQDIQQTQINDIIELSDYHTLEAIGDSFSANIIERNVWEDEHFTTYGLLLEVDDDTTLMLLVREIGEEIDYRVFRLWEEGILQNVQTECIDTEIGDFVSFSEDLDPTEDICEYVIKEPYPFWGIKKNDTEEGLVGICEYLINEDDVDGFWAKHCFVEWYSELDDQGLATVWFGWDVSPNDINILRN